MTEKKQYTLDRIEDGFYVFLLHIKEQDELLIPASRISVKLSEDDMVCISKTNSYFVIEVLESETEIMRDS